MSWGSNSSRKQEAGLSKENEQLLQAAMQKRGLSLRAMQDVTSSIKRGDGNWADHLNTSTSSFQQPSSKTNAKVKVPKFAGGSNSMPQPSAPYSFSGKRMNIEPVEREMWAGCAPGPDREAEKERLSKVMELGAKQLKAMELREAERRADLLRRQADPIKPVDLKEELIDQVVEEIRERREFLEQMQKVGKAATYDAIMKGEIAARLKELGDLGLDVRSGRPR
ncbi:hypothetical protein CEUSTIGMA_g8898.t1 [Chlamydomonas eustigma]|uniref:Uncharacterized protein n=1 Tax=Chlamydomonas eustigma TaxID=1157962 RepID=A0A250XEW7_9CHLO|nr:hypothetical protein CEUSTIGMA_g8898.t1 [Chlamydomonas eustigma]|eukprot:GAX81469.1 hypothetical protein CEUSTIGMA_g8898.t1 [Chlamydomonas eustigma]